ncbi:hypothetical protein DP939_37985 [Spongiactinospora rosea]|uniref:TIR domain-containing protein n=1 Tax=Spongiactinospora rosea TaxID=2248750 RepID=A0A366LMV2_9ACTN|nr:TIR domain-containing protein [Spongiactinospora rosea]RBQ14980.1 hypothetical protein DP939_37985 [Spongiactinospora rosea]
MEPDEYDVFLSYAGDDREIARELEQALRGVKVHGRPMRVFRDERSIDHHESITKRITESVLASTVFLAYYSRAYPTRPACQLEMTFAFLLAQRGDTAAGRILVINPEESGDHIEPVQLRDLKYRPRPVTAADHRRFAEDVAGHVARSPGPPSAAGPVPPARWWPGDPLPDRGMIHRYSEMWQLHSALHAGEFGLVERGPAIGVAVISGLPGTGKTTLAAQYAQEFAAAFLGGVYRFTLDPDQDGPDLLLDYRRALRTMAADRGIALDGADDDRLCFRVADHFGRQARPVLWIVDQVPAGVPDEVVRELLVPSRWVRTILTCREHRYTDIGAPVHLSRLTEAEGLALLEDAYDTGEESEAAGLVGDLGGHPQDLRIAGAKLRAARGLVSLPEYRAKIRDEVDSVLQETLRELDASALSVLAPALFLAPVPIPRGVLRRTAEARHGWTEREAWDRLLPALTSLTRMCVVSAAGDGVFVHPRVVRALPPGAASGLLPAVGAAVAEYLTGPDAPAPSTVAHARHLVTGPDLPDDLAISLLTELVAIDERAASHLSAARLAQRLVSRLRHRYGDEDARTRQAAAAAALALVTVADYSAATELARLALHPTSDEATAQALHGLAAGLDGLGRFSEAEPHWQRLEHRIPDMSPEHADRVRIDRARALRQRGRLPEAAALLAEVTDPDLPQRHLEEALIHGLHQRPRLAMAAAERALAGFERAGLAQHPLAFEAAVALVDAKLSAFARSPNPFTKMDRQQLVRMREVCEEYERRLGPANPLTLSARVAYGISVAGWQDGRTGRAILEAADQDARAALGERHPIRLRIQYGLSGAAMNLHDFETSAEYASRAYHGRLIVLGEQHPETLASLMQLGIARVSLSDDPEAAEMIKQATRGLQKIHPLWHGEVVRGYIAQGFGSLPRPVYEGMMRATFLATEAPGALKRMLKNWTDRK